MGFLAGVSECIIMGMPMSIGTGIFKLLHKYPFPINFCFSFQGRDLYVLALNFCLCGAIGHVLNKSYLNKT